MTSTILISSHFPSLQLQDRPCEVSGNIEGDDIFSADVVPATDPLLPGEERVRVSVADLGRSPCTKTLAAKKIAKDRQTRPQMKC